MKVNWVFRPNSIYKGKSIESVFLALKPYISNQIEINEIHLPGSGKPFLDIYHQIRFLKSQNLAGLTHVLGDVHYLSKWLPKEQIHTFHDIESLESGNKLRQIVKKNQWIYSTIKNSVSVSVVSQHTKNKILNLYPQFEGKIRIIKNPLLINPRFIKEKVRGGSFKLLSVGTKPNKNLDRIALAISKLDFNYKWHVVGELSEFQFRLFSSLNIVYENHVNLNLAELSMLYESSDVLLFPSLYEGFGLPILEAQAHGAAVITSNITAMPEVGRNSVFYVSPLNVNEISQGIQQLNLNKSLREDLIQKGYENIKRYQIEDIALQYIDWYKQVLGGE